jgi:hypothetical protein
MGFKFRESWTLACQRTDRFTNIRGQVVTVKGAIRGGFENRYIVLDVLNGELMKYERRVIKGDNDFTYEYPRGRKRTLDHIDELAGQVVVSDKIGNTWRHTLVEEQPNIQQETALDRLRSPFEDREHIPAGKHAPGFSWEVDATQIKRLLGSSVKAVSGKMTARFMRLDVLRGETCAVIEYRGTMRVRSEPEDDIPERVETCDLVQESQRSLKNGIFISSICNFHLRSTGMTRLDGHDVRFEGSGHTRVTYRAEVEN